MMNTYLTGEGWEFNLSKQAIVYLLLIVYDTFLLDG